MKERSKTVVSVIALLLLIAACLLLLGVEFGFSPFAADPAQSLAVIHGAAEGESHREAPALRELEFDLSQSLEDRNADYVLDSEYGLVVRILKYVKDGTPLMQEIDVFSGDLIGNSAQSVVSQLRETEGAFGSLAWRLEGETISVSCGADLIRSYKASALRGVITGGSGALCWLDGTTLHMVFPDDHECGDYRITSEEAEKLRFGLFRSKASFVKRTGDKLIYSESSYFDHMPRQGSDVIIWSMELASGECAELARFSAIIWEYKEEGDDLIVFSDEKKILRIDLGK